jgi:hypothetical protein
MTFVSSYSFCNIYPIPSANTQKYRSLIPLSGSHATGVHGNMASYPPICLGICIYQLNLSFSAVCSSVLCSESLELTRGQIYFSQTKSTNRHVLDMLPTQVWIQLELNITSAHVVCATQIPYVIRVDLKRIWTSSESHQQLANLSNLILF